MSVGFCFCFNFFRSDLYFSWKTIPKPNIGLYCRIFLTYFIVVVKMAGEIGDLFIGDGDDGVLRSSNDMCLRIDSDITVEVATVRVFVVGRVYVLDDLRQLVISFGLAWQFCTA